MLTLRSGRWRFVVIETESGSWILCWDVTVADVYVVVVVDVVVLFDVVVLDDDDDDDFTHNF
jgi:hypothetical protein